MIVDDDESKINKAFQSAFFFKCLICSKTCIRTYMMKKLLFAGLLLLNSTLFAQKYSGQWSGSFDSFGDPKSETRYVLEIEANGNLFEGNSYTYYLFEGKSYYTICSIKGTIEPKSKTLTATELKVIKKNTPPDIGDCLQIHTLTYFKKGDTEELSGTWKGANPKDKCGTGNTLLSRKQLVKNIITTPPPQNNTVRMNPTPPKPNASKPANNTVKTQPKPNTVKPQPKKDSIVKAPPAITKVDNRVETPEKVEIKPSIPAPKLPNGLERRDNKIYETIVINEADITVNLYDNAEIDGDIITVLFNGEVVASQKMLSDKPITLNLKAIRGRDNTLTMYAENQGRVPPNTAIMRVQIGEQYYKVFLSADDKKNGSVVFRFKS